MIGELIEARVTMAARRAAFGTIGLVFILIGLAFLTVAGFIALAAATDALIAALIIGAAYFGVGAIILGVAALRRHRIPARGTTAAAAEATPNGAMLPAAVQAFLFGLSAGFSSGGRKR